MIPPVNSVNICQRITESLKGGLSSQRLADSIKSRKVSQQPNYLYAILNGVVLAGGEWSQEEFLPIRVSRYEANASYIKESALGFWTRDRLVQGTTQNGLIQRQILKERVGFQSFGVAGDGRVICYRCSVASGESIVFEVVKIPWDLRFEVNLSNVLKTLDMPSQQHFTLDVNYDGEMGIKSPSLGNIMNGGGRVFNYNGEIVELGCEPNADRLFLKGTFGEEVDIANLGDLLNALVVGTTDLELPIPSLF